MAKGTQFTLENLRLLDFGKIGAAFQVELERVVKDCMDRPGDDHAREVTIKFRIAPTEEGGITNCDTVSVECEISSAVPKRRTKVYEMRPNINGQLTFNPDLSAEPDGQTMFDEHERKEDSNE